MKVLLIAGNGFIGRPTARRLLAEGHEVFVHHTGQRPLPEAPGLRHTVVPRTPLPITQFPEDLVLQGVDVAIHFLCMGQEDAAGFVRAFDGRARRLVLVSSADVYRAYGRLIGTEPGPLEPTPLDEHSPLRERLYPYREKAQDHAALEYWYDKIEAERAVLAAAHSEVTIMRLPKVYGEEKNAELTTVYGFARCPQWRWTHGYVGNVAAAIALAAVHPLAAGQTFNVGEAETPTIRQRLACLPPRTSVEDASTGLDCAQDLAVSTAKIRELLGFRDPHDEPGAMRRISMQRELRGHET